LEAAQQIEMTVKMVHEINSIFGEIWFLSQLSGMYLDQGRIKEAEALLPPMQAALEASGGKAYRVQARSAWLQADLYKGNLESSMPGLSSEKQTAIENNDKQQVIAFSFSLALGYWLERDYTRAASELQFGIDQAGIWAGPNYKYLLASLLARSESATSKAREMFDQADAQALGREGVVPTYEQETNRHYALMHIYAREGNSPEALNHASIAVQRYRDAHLRWLYAHVLCEYGDIALEAKDAAKARELYNLSLAEFEVMQAPIFVDRVREKIRQVL
jgi:tetratricopeptide (TPR) repeat protein